MTITIIIITDRVNYRSHLLPLFHLVCVCSITVSCSLCVSVVIRLSAIDLICGANQCCSTAPPSTSLLPVSRLL